MDQAERLSQQTQSQERYRSSGIEIAERLGRIGLLLEASRVDLFSAKDGLANLEAFWTASGIDSAPSEGELEPIALSWYPWSLGNVRSTEYMFVRQGDALPLSPTSELKLEDVGLSSTLHMPIAERGVLRGAVCCYWLDELSEFDDTSCHKVWEWALDSLDWANRSR